MGGLVKLFCYVMLCCVVSLIAAFPVAADSPSQKSQKSEPYAILAQAEPWSLIGVPVGFRGKVAEAVAADDTSTPSMTNEEAAAEPPIKSINAWKDRSASAEPMIVAAPLVRSQESRSHWRRYGKEGAVGDTRRGAPPHGRDGSGVATAGHPDRIGQARTRNGKPL
ncbi:MAG: hypothetical protein HY314_08620 [Acidobacteria bacterium]|nr:hypothetical protein [Acidobacteriota bacterium]